MSSNCCKANTSAGENCCCKSCNSPGCYPKQVHGACRMDMPCARMPGPRPPNFNKVFKNHRNPDLPWLDWHFRPSITSDSTDTNHYAYQLKRHTPCIGDVYFHDLPEDSKKFI
ncbi:uncharacterized protein LOC129579369 [Sitodiplosis mosellana]|uniref:uncharacterized protein LOC129579369 n=1 Tax=Sitodiplosis mosellana TaxID=263140 RepID=UPI002443A807|nr:uncharacterized protein LOC129579369 [Sitodiplosis mosellana]